MKIGFTLNGAPVCVEAPGTVSLSKSHFFVQF